MWLLFYENTLLYEWERIKDLIGANVSMAAREWFAFALKNGIQ